MALYKRGKTWWMSFNFNGKHIQKSTKSTNKRTAETIESAYRTQLAKGEVGIQEKKTFPNFDEAMKDFLAWSKHEHFNKPNTYLGYENSSKSLLKFFRDKPVDKIDPDSVEQFKKWRSSQKRWGKSKKVIKTGNDNSTIRPSTVNRELACLKIFFNRLIKNDLLLTNPVSKIKLYNEDNIQTRVVSEEEIASYLEFASQPLSDVTQLMIETGMRPEEILRMEKVNVHVNKGYVFIPFGKTKAAKRKIPLTQIATEIIKKRLETQSNLLFVSEKTGKQITSLKTAHYGAIKRSKVDFFRIYDLRHTFATRFIESGGDLVTLKTLLGHSNIQMVTRYAHPTEKHQFEAIKMMESKRLSKTA